ncbi:hypothetical protein TKK_0018663 [Trichogramma kaykai]|uniref:Uncharacterized protein n=1 Tax=Trichogramma kaykai TaxID=54128 RepID=A0ABD2VYP5_9HYME
MCRRQDIPEVTRPDTGPGFLIDFPDWESIESEGLDHVNFTWDEPIGFDSDGEPIYEDSEGDDDNDSVISWFHWTMDILHIDELFASKGVTLHGGRVVVDFYY